MTRLLCSVRGCGQPLARGERRLVCPQGHSFDVARRGYVNLLQPQDRRSAQPGDSRTAAEARRRLYEAGHGAPLLAELDRQLAALDLPARPALLDVGCGEGSLLGALAAARPLDACGLDLSLPAIELAARRFPALSWLIANADRFLPVAGGTVDVVLLLTARASTSELHRVLAAHGRLLVATPAADDLVEARAALLGEGVRRPRLERALAELIPSFALEDRATVRRTVALDADAVRDALTATYRGRRQSEQDRLAALGPLEVTMSFEVARLRPR